MNRGKYIKPVTDEKYVKRKNEKQIGEQSKEKLKKYWSVMSGYMGVQYRTEWRKIVENVKMNNTSKSSSRVPNSPHGMCGNYYNYYF